MDMLSRGLRRLGGLLALAVPLGALMAGSGQAAAGAASVPPGLAGAVRNAELPALQAIGATAAWRLARGQGVTVGVLDTGVGAGAPDLAGVVTSGPDYTAGINPPGYQPPHLHGTFIASLIAGHGSGPGQAGGVIGVAPAARILSVRVLPDDQEPGFAVYNGNAKYENAIGRGIRYAVRHRVSVINMSLGSPTATRGLRAAVAYAISHGVVVVAAAGNSGRAGQRFTPYSYPAAYPGVISVAAVSNAGSRASFSDRNASVVVAAPGVSIVGAAPAGDYVQADGTSPASAFVAGVAALIRSAYPKLPPALVAQALIVSTRHRPRRGYSTDVGFGEVNAPAALQAARRLAAQRPAAGESPSARVAAAGPVQVVHRDAARIYGYGAISAAATLGFLTALVLIAVLARRALRDRRIAPAHAHSAPASGSGPTGPGTRYPGPGYPGPGLAGPGYPGPGYAGTGEPGTGPGTGSVQPGRPGQDSPGAGNRDAWYPGAGLAGSGYPEPGPGAGHPGPSGYPPPPGPSGYPPLPGPPASGEAGPEQPGEPGSGQQWAPPP